MMVFGFQPIKNCGGVYHSRVIELASRSTNSSKVIFSKGS